MSKSGAFLKHEATSVRARVWLAYGPGEGRSCLGIAKEVHCRHPPSAGRSRTKANLILTWGGLRGGPAVAMALSLPHGQWRDVIVTITCTVVIFSILVQGLTVGRLVRSVSTADAQN